MSANVESKLADGTGALKSDGEGKKPSPEALEKTYENANYFSEKASEVCRQLAAAGLAVLWIFKPETTSSESFVRQIVPSAALLILVLILDATHYIYGSRIWTAAARAGRTGVRKGALKPLEWLFWLKLATLTAAYIAVLVFVVRRAGY
jgi:hypothetical protein